MGSHKHLALVRPAGKKIVHLIGLDLDPFDALAGLFRRQPDCAERPFEHGVFALSLADFEIHVEGTVEDDVLGVL